MQGHHAAQRLADRDPALPTAGVRMPTVAAIVCNYNQKAYVEAAIASVAQQSYPYLECVVVDDCSTDGSGEDIERVLACQTGKRFRFIRHTENRGQMAAMLSGLDATTAPFVAWLDADDIWLPEYIERHMAHHLNAQVNAAISTSNVGIIDAAGTLIAGADPAMSRNSPVRKRKRAFAIAAARLQGPAREIDHAAAAVPRAPVFVSRGDEPSWIWSATSGMVFRRAAIDAIRPLNAEKLRICADNYLARFSHLIGGTIWIGETLGCYRIHGHNRHAKNAVHGDGAGLGKTPRDIKAEVDYQFARKLFESSDIPMGLLPRRERRRVLLRIARRNEVVGRILTNRALVRRLPLWSRLYLLGRYAILGFWRVTPGSRGAAHQP